MRARVRHCEWRKVRDASTTSLRIRVVDSELPTSVTPSAARGTAKLTVTIPQGIEGKGGVPTCTRPERLSYSQKCAPYLRRRIADSDESTLVTDAD